MTPEVFKGKPTPDVAHSDSKSTVGDKSKAKGWTGTRQCEAALLGPFTWVKDQFGTQTHICPPKETHSESQCGQPIERWLSSEIYVLNDDTVSPAGIHNLKYRFFFPLA